MPYSVCLETDSKQEARGPHENKAGCFTEPLKRRFLAKHLPEVKDGPQGEAENKTQMNKTSPSPSLQEERVRKEES